MGREEKFQSTGLVPPHACWACYAAVAACFVLLFCMPVDHRPWHNGLCASIFATLVVYAFAVAYRNTSVYDPFWAWFPIFAASGWMATAASSPSARGWYTLGLLLLWCGRYNLQWPWEGWTVGIHTEDWRYVRMARTLGLVDSRGPVYWIIVSLVASHLVPTMLVWFVLAPVQHVWTAGSSGSPLGPLDALAAATSVGGVVLQFVSDCTLRRFRERSIQNKQQSLETSVCSKTCREGPWAYSRHPNYLGEVLFWLGMDMAALAGGGWATSWAWCLGGIINYLCFFRVSASLMDQRSLENRPGYAQVMEEVSGLVPCLLAIDRALDRLLIGGSSCGRRPA